MVAKKSPTAAFTAGPSLIGVDQAENRCAREGVTRGQELRDAQK
jgi:hypothetical protein